MKILFWFIIQFFICYSSISQKRNGNLFEGMLYYAVNTGSSKSDTVILFVHQNKLLSIWNSKTFKKKGQLRD